MQAQTIDKSKDVFLYEFKTSYAELSPSQFLPGYCVLLSKIPYPSLNDMPLPERQDYLMEMGILGDAMMETLGCIRINYNILGNSYPVLHAHLFPRYAWEEEEKRLTVVWRYDVSNWDSPLFSLAEHGEMKQRLAAAIDRRYRTFLEGVAK